MVRLKGASVNTYPYSSSYFNSTMVRLKAIVRFSENRYIFHFNSTMVRLKANKKRHEAGGRNLFQFHYGSIKGYQLVSSAYSWQKFQFHYGSIKGLFLDVANSIKDNFNSTMVRLKGRLKFCHIHIFQISIPLWFD